MNTKRIQQGKFDTRGDVAVAGSAALLAGASCSGCAIVTIIGIPVLIITLPISLLGLVILLVAPFLKTKDITCPKCKEINHILNKRKTFVCRECDTTIILDSKGKPTA